MREDQWMLGKYCVTINDMVGGDRMDRASVKVPGALSLNCMWNTVWLSGGATPWNHLWSRFGLSTVAAAVSDVLTCFRTSRGQKNMSTEYDTESIATVWRWQITVSRYTDMTENKIFDEMGREVMPKIKPWKGIQLQKWRIIKSDRVLELLMGSIKSPSSRPVFVENVIRC